MRYIGIKVIIAAVAGLFFLPFLGKVNLFDWDEINFAELAREMLETGDYLRMQINYLPFWEKPPLFIWFQALSMKLFGVGEYAARFPNAILGIITLVSLFDVGTKLFDVRYGMIWVLTYFGSILPHLYFRSGIIDPYFNFFIFFGLYNLILFHWKRDKFPKIELKRSKWFYLIKAGIFVGLGVLTKGPVAFLIPGIVLFVYWIYLRLRFYITPLHVIVYTIFVLLVTAIWFGIETYYHGTWLIEEFVTYQYRLFSTPDAGHGGFPGYHFVVILLGCFPASIFMIKSFFQKNTEFRFEKNMKVWMTILLFVVLILFTIVKSKIVHYSSLAYFPATFLAALALNHLMKKKEKLGFGVNFGLIFIGSIIVLSSAAIAYFGQHIEILKPLFEKDKFALANLNAKVDWSNWDMLPGIVFAVFFLVSLFFFRKKIHEIGTFSLFFGTAVYVFLALTFYINKIEAYSQRAAIEFYEQLQGKDVYVEVDGFKSYAQLFYTQKPNPKNKKSLDKGWLLKGKVDKDVYIVTKNTFEHAETNFKDAQKLYEKNGFVFYLRKAQ